MKQNLRETAPKEQWTLIRNARQLLTLRGASGPRRGPALGELGIVKDGALLLRNGLIEEAGTARRVENLKQARNAREIDAGGRVVMPAFVDPDAVLVYPPTTNKRETDPTQKARLCLVSKHRLSQSAAAAAADWVRSGVLSVGAHTGYAADLRDTLRILRIHQKLQSKPLRIRSIFSPLTAADGEEAAAALLLMLQTKSLAAVRKRKLAGIIEFTLESRPSHCIDVIRQAAISAAEAGYSVRIRMHEAPGEEMLELTLGAASVALIAPPLSLGSGFGAMGPLARLGCVHVFQVTAALSDDWRGAPGVREEIGKGVPVAIASGFRPSGVTSLNPQFLLHLAVDRCGMTPEEAIVASTYNAACSLRTSHVTGSLEPGKAADLLVLDVTDYRELIHRVGHNDVQMVMRAGNPVYRRSPLMLD